MRLQNPAEPAIDAFAEGCIRRKARQVARRPGFTPSDRADIEQELRLKLLRQFPSFDPSQGTRRAFVVTVVQRCAAARRDGISDPPCQ